GGDVVQPVHVRGGAGVGAVLGDLLDAPVQVADVAVQVHDLFAVQLQDHPEHPVCGRVLGTHVQDHHIFFQDGGCRGGGCRGVTHGGPLPRVRRRGRAVPGGGRSTADPARGCHSPSAAGDRSIP